MAKRWQKCGRQVGSAVDCVMEIKAVQASEYFFVTLTNQQPVKSLALLAKHSDKLRQRRLVESLSPDFQKLAHVTRKMTKVQSPDLQYFSSNQLRNKHAISLPVDYEFVLARCLPP